MNWNASKFWIDGGCLGNEGYGVRKAYGSISDGETIVRLQFADARTNNEAEYRILIALLEKLIRNRVHPQKPQIEIYTDSQLVVGHLREGAQVRAKNLVPLHRKATSFLQKTGARLVWISRDQIVEKLGH